MSVRVSSDRPFSLWLNSVCILCIGSGIKFIRKILEKKLELENSGVSESLRAKPEVHSYSRPLLLGHIYTSVTYHKNSIYSAQNIQYRDMHITDMDIYSCAKYSHKLP